MTNADASPVGEETEEPTDVRPHWPRDLPDLRELLQGRAMFHVEHYPWNFRTMVNATDGLRGMCRLASGERNTRPVRRGVYRTRVLHRRVLHSARARA